MQNPGETQSKHLLRNLRPPAFAHQGYLSRKALVIKKFQMFDDILKGIEHVTLPVIMPSVHGNDGAGDVTRGEVLNVCMLRVSISNTLFASWTTLRSPVASSSFSFHSSRI